ncbi:Uncharacterised protein [Escherichia coli]|nr:Uncharacterised protein [Escherichia coli]CAD6180410.1 Uncharacterised protein [Escherichia coli]
MNFLPAMNSRVAEAIQQKFRAWDLSHNLIDL